MFEAGFLFRDSLSWERRTRFLFLSRPSNAATTTITRSNRTSIVRKATYANTSSSASSAHPKGGVMFCIMSNLLSVGMATYSECPGRKKSLQHPVANSSPWQEPRHALRPVQSSKASILFLFLSNPSSRASTLLGAEGLVQQAALEQKLHVSSRPTVGLVCSALHNVLPQDSVHLDF